MTVIASMNDYAPKPNEKPDRRRRRRQEAIDNATRIFQDKGYAATTIQDIADSMGILKGSLYHYFDSKEEILFAVIAAFHVPPVLGEEGALPPLTLIYRFIEEQVVYLCDNLSSATVFLRDFRALGLKFHDRIKQDRDAYFDVLHGLIVFGQRDGTVRSDLDAKLAALAIMGMMNWTYTWYRPSGKVNPSVVGRELAGLAVAGLKA